MGPSTSRARCTLVGSTVVGGATVVSHNCHNSLHFWRILCVQYLHCTPHRCTVNHPKSTPKFTPKIKNVFLCTACTHKKSFFNKNPSLDTCFLYDNYELCYCRVIDRTKLLFFLDLSYSIMTRMKYLGLSALARVDFVRKSCKKSFSRVQFSKA